MMKKKKEKTRRMKRSNNKKNGFDVSVVEVHIAGKRKFFHFFFASQTHTRWQWQTFHRYVPHFSPKAPATEKFFFPFSLFFLFVYVYSKCLTVQRTIENREHQFERKRIQNEHTANERRGKKRAESLSNVHVLDF